MGPRRALLTLADRERRKSDWRDARDAGGHETRGHETRALLYDSSHTTHAGVLVRSYARLLSSPNSLDSSSGSSVAARATRSSAFLFVMDRNMQVFANADNIGAAHPRAVRTGDRVSRRLARTESNYDPPNGHTDTTRERQDARKMAPVCVFFDVFMFSRRPPRSPRGTRRERGALASTTAEGTRDTRVDLARVHPGGGREAATRYDEPMASEARDPEAPRRAPRGSPLVPTPAHSHRRARSRRTCTSRALPWVPSPAPRRSPARRLSPSR